MDSPHAIFPPALDYMVDHPTVILHNENCWALIELGLVYKYLNKNFKNDQV